jgi:HAD superfamily hydrolase (TIGR01509 family)
MVETIIFDMDGLMIDSERVTYDGYVKLCAEQGKEMNKEIYVQMLGKNVAGIHQVFYDHFGDDFPAPQTMKDCHKYMADLFENEGVPIKEGLHELLQYCKDHQIRCVVATSSTRDRVDKILEQAGITDYFYDSVCGNEVERGKPNPDIFLKAAEKCGTAPENCVVLEDSESGIEAGYRANIPTICIPDMKFPEPEFAQKTTSIQKSLLDVITMLENDAL